MYSNWIRSGIMYVNDLYDDNGRFIQGIELYNKLGDKSNWIAEYMVVKNVIHTMAKKFNIDTTQGRYINIKNFKSPTIKTKTKIVATQNRRANFFYEILISKKCTRAFMEKTWQKEFDIVNAHNHCTKIYNWSKIYDAKIKRIEIKKLAEFNYKLLTGILPCGYMLNKWNKDISDKCDVCKERENIKHMLFDCVKTRDIWKTIGKCFNVNIRWKHIVIGYYDDVNKLGRLLNLLYTYVAYNIFKANNKCKWEQKKYSNCNVKRQVICNLIYLDKILLNFKEPVIPSDCIKDIIEQLETT
jgi:hypothetical protein